MNQVIKKIYKKLQLLDFIWSVPLSFLFFILYGKFQEWYFHDPFYSTEWFHRSLMVSVIIIGWSGLIMGFMWFHHRKSFKAYYLYKESRDYSNLPAWLRVFAYPIMFFLMLYCFIAVFKAIG